MSHQIKFKNLQLDIPQVQPHISQTDQTSSSFHVFLIRLGNNVASLFSSASHSIMNARSPSFIRTPYKKFNSIASLYSYHPKKALPTIQPRSAGRNLVPSLREKFCCPSTQPRLQSCAYDVWESLAPPASGSLAGGSSLKTQECKSGVTPTTTPNPESNIWTRLKREKV